MGAIKGLLKSGVMALCVALVVAPPSANATFPGVNGKIAFTSTRDGNWEIYSVNPDGTGLTRLTNDPAIEESPAWSADGSKIAFVRRTQSDFQTGEIYVMNADGTGKRQLTDDGEIDANPSWSPDGSRLVFDSTRTTVKELYTIRLDGAGEAPIGPFGVEGNDPSWSSNGRRLAFTDGGDIFGVDLDGTHLIDLTNDRFGVEQHPNWSPVGSSRIAFNDSQPDLFVVTENARPVRLPGGDGASSWPAWSPDGTRIAFENSTYNAPIPTIYTMKSDGSNRALLLPRDSANREPDWGPAQPRPFPPAVEVTGVGAPVCTLHATPARTFRRFGAFRLKIRCDQSARVSLKGSVSIHRRGRLSKRLPSLSLYSRAVTVGAGESDNVNMHLPKRALKQVVTAMRRRHEVEVSFIAKAAGDGGTSTVKARIKKLRLR